MLPFQMAGSIDEDMILWHKIPKIRRHTFFVHDSRHSVCQRIAEKAQSWDFGKQHAHDVIELSHWELVSPTNASLAAITSGNVPMYKIHSERTVNSRSLRHVIKRGW